MSQRVPRHVDRIVIHYDAALLVLNIGKSEAEEADTFYEAEIIFSVI